MKETLKTATRKAIYVDEAVFNKFRKAAQADDRKYSPFLNKLLTQEKNLQS